MTATYESDRGRKVRLWAIVVGGIAAILAVASFYTQIVETEVELIEMDGFQVILLYVEPLFIFLSAIVAVIGYILSWWYKLPAGILLVLAAIILGVIGFFPDSFLTPSTVAGRQAGPEAAGGPIFIFSIPALVAGILFLWYSWLAKRSTLNIAGA